MSGDSKAKSPSRFGDLAFFVIPSYAFSKLPVIYFTSQTFQYDPQASLISFAEQRLNEILHASDAISSIANGHVSGDLHR